jgi:hypothetical protein
VYFLLKFSWYALSPFSLPALFSFASPSPFWAFLCVFSHIFLRFSRRFSLIQQAPAGKKEKKSNATTEITDH